MSTQSLNIVQAIRGVIRGELGSVRTVPAAAFGEDVHGGSTDAEKWLRAKVKKRFDVKITPPVRTGAIGPSTANLAILSYDIVVTLTYASEHLEDLVDDRRYLIRATAAADAATITEALEWPGNLLVDTSATVTNLVSARIREAAKPRVSREDWGAGIYEVELTFVGLEKETKAVA